MAGDDIVQHPVELDAGKEGCFRHNAQILDQGIQMYRQTARMDVIRRAQAHDKVLAIEARNQTN